jgi:protein TonB
MKTTINLFFLFFFSLTTFAKADSATKPQFPGGDKALVEYLNKSLIYPAEALKQKWSGKTLVAFVINEDGTIVNVHVIKSSWGLLDNEAVRIVKMMPKWIPATENGVNKKEMVVLPVSFDLTKKNLLYE